MGQYEVTAFLSHLATEKQVSAATQNQGLAALLFLYSEVLGQGLEWSPASGSSAARNAPLAGVLTATDAPWRPQSDEHVELEFR